MFYVLPLTIPANTDISAPVEEELDLTYGVIQRVEIEFPPGCAGLAHVKISYHEFDLYPSNPGVYFSGDGFTVAFDDNFLITEVPHAVKIIGYNEDDTFDHTVTVRINVKLPELTLADILGVSSISHSRKE